MICNHINLTMREDIHPKRMRFRLFKINTSQGWWEGAKKIFSRWIEGRVEIRKSMPSSFPRAGLEPRTVC